MIGRGGQTAPSRKFGNAARALPSRNDLIRKSPATNDREAGPRLRVAIAADSSLVQDVLSRLLGADPALRIVGQARDERELDLVLRRERPEALLLDYESMSPGGENVISRLRRAAPATRILVMGSQSGNERVGRVLRAGASGLVGKNINVDTLIKAIRVVARGEVWANRRNTARALEDLSSRLPGVEDRLTQRERQVADGVGQGLRNKEIAIELKISQKTVKSHLNNIFRKMRLDSRVELARLVAEGASRQTL
jgi:DNA-binding NarL/FixJ family response regulator